MEAGCGTGTTICNLASLFPAASFLGVDLTPNSLKLATERAPKMELSNTRFELHGLNNLELAEGAGMSLFRWLAVSNNITKLIPSDLIGELFEVLSRFDQLKILDYLLKPDHYTMVFRIED